MSQTKHEHYALYQGGSYRLGIVRVEPGQSYPELPSKTNEHHEPLIEFYDPHEPTGTKTEYGRFVTRVAQSDLHQHLEQGRLFTIDAGDSAWHLSDESLTRIVSWLADLERPTLPRERGG